MATWRVTVLLSRSRFRLLICLTCLLYGCRFAWVQIMKTNLKIFYNTNGTNSSFLSGNSGSKLRQSLIWLYWFDPVSRVWLFHPAEKHNFSFSFLWGQLNWPCAPNPKDIYFHYNCRQELTYSDFRANPPPPPPPPPLDMDAFESKGKVKGN